MAQAAEYMDQSYYGADEYGTQRISYTVYLLPDDVYVDPRADAPLELLEGCESQNATHLEEAAEI